MTVKWPAVLVTPSFVRAAETRLMCTVDPELYHQGATTPEAAEMLCRGCEYLSGERVCVRRRVRRWRPVR